MKYGKWFVRINWITLVLIYLVVIAGSFVRITGSGMGCPDWPKCFGQWVPPTEKSELPDNYKEIYSEKRSAKVEKFCSMLEKIGMTNTAKKIRSDKSILVEESFNAQKTWTEYVNRLFGFLAGNGVLLIFLWILFKYRKKKLIIFSGLNLVILAFQAWFGSIVVATNLVPWTITVHLFLALLIIGIQFYILRLIAPSQQRNIPVSSTVYYLIFIIFLVTFIQMFLGTQVREEIDHMRKAGIEREAWSENFGLAFFIHRSFSWLVLALIVGIYWIKRKDRNLMILRWIFFILIVELVSGVLLAHFNMPGLVQTAHLVFASILFGMLLMAVFRMKHRTLIF
ncbi:MAG: COX15/CtaA family protein [Brumimicrobium sp.]|nr:COX15/CtaA family protein [Brumimicrobium sp.]